MLIFVKKKKDKAYQYIDVKITRQISTFSDYAQTIFLVATMKMRSYVLD